MRAPPGAAGVEGRFVESGFFKDAETLRQQPEEALGGGDSGPLTPVEAAGAYRFLFATADQIFSHASALRFLNGMRQWAGEAIRATHASTPQIHVYNKACFRELARDSVQVRWHYLYSLTRGGAATIRLLRKPDPDKIRLGVSLGRTANLRLQFNQLLVHETCEFYALTGTKHATDTLSSAILLHGYLWQSTTPG